MLGKSKLLGVHIFVVLTVWNLGEMASTAVGQEKYDRAMSYISQLKNIHCPQIVRGGSIDPYLAVVDGEFDENPPTLKLKELGFDAVPALIKALDDDTSTKTVHYFGKADESGADWLVSDFAWWILRDITRKEFGYETKVGITLSHSEPEDRQRVIDEIKKWYSENKDLPQDDRMFAFFESDDYREWITAGQYFLQKNDKRAVRPLIEKIPTARDFTKGDLSELVGRFGDSQAAAVLKHVLKTASEPSDRLGAAIGLWELGDESGIPQVIDYVTSQDRPYGLWQEPIWFLMRTKTETAMAALTWTVTKAPPHRAGEVIGHIASAANGQLDSGPRKPAGSVQVCSVLIAAMDRADQTGFKANGIALRVKDIAARAFVIMRERSEEEIPSSFVQINPKLFDESEPDQKKRDYQIDALKRWYKANESNLRWNSKTRTIERKR